MSTDLIGTTVISWDDTDPVVYVGENDHPGMTSLTFSLRYGGLPGLRCELERVAPVDTPIPASDERVQITKHEGKLEYWMRGRWILTIAGQEGKTHHKTKRDATATGLRRIAIIDFHAAGVKAQHDDTIGATA